MIAVAMLPERVGLYPDFRRANSTRVWATTADQTIRFEVVEPAPRAASPAVGALEAGDAGLDASAEVAQPAIDPSESWPCRRRPALLVEGDIGDATRFGLIEIVALA
jgi:hypothetical protein